MKIKVIVILGFIVAFAAGWVSALLVQQTRATATVLAPDRPPRRPWLAEELGLDARQAEEVKRIWSDAMRSARREHEERRHALRKQREDAIAALIPPQDKAAYEQFHQQYLDEMGKIGREREGLFEQAVAKTKALLTPEQRVKYEALLAKRGEWERRDRGPGSRRRPGSHEHNRHNRRPGDRTAAPPPSEKSGN